MNFGGLGINKNKENNRFDFKRDLQPVIMKDKKSDNLFGYNNNKNDIFGIGASRFGKNNDKFSSFERNNPLINQFNNEMSGVSRRKRNFYSSPNNIGWGGL